jgi:hypothetical protein
VRFRPFDSNKPNGRLVWRDRVATGPTHLFFIVIVVVPVTAVTAYGWSAVARTTQRQVRSELELARAPAQVAVDDRLRRARDAVIDLARDPDLLRAMAAGDAGQVRAVLRRQGPSDLLLAVTAPDARVLGRGGHTSPGFLPGTRRAPLGMLLPASPARSSAGRCSGATAPTCAPGTAGAGRGAACWGRSRPASGWTTRGCSGWPGPPWTPT